MMPGLSNSIGAVIVHYHRENELAMVLTDLLASGVDPANIVVSNNGGDRSRLDSLATRVPQATWVDLPNPGYGAAVNAGFRALPTRVETVLIATHELRFGPDMVPSLVSALQRPDVALVGPRLVDADSGRIWSLGGKISALRGIPSNLRGGHAFGTPREVDWLDGACLLVRRSDHEAIGGMCEDYFLYVEDVDYAVTVRRRLRRRVMLVPQVVAYQSSGGGPSTYLATRNMLILHRRSGRWGAAAFCIVEALGRILAGVVVGRGAHRDRQRERWRGLRDGLKYRI